MADFSLRDLWWLQPKGPDNPLPALQLGAQIAQNKAQMDLHERDLANDIARTSLMREEQIYKRGLQTKLMAGNAAMAKAIAEITDFADPEQMKRVWSVGELYPMEVGGKAWQGAEYMHRNAVIAKQKAQPDKGIAEAVTIGFDESGNPITENFVRFGNRVFRSTQHEIVEDPKTKKRFIKSGSGALHALDTDAVDVSTNPDTGQQFVQALPIVDSSGKQVGIGYRGSQGNIIRLPEPKLSQGQEKSYQNELKALNEKEEAELKGASGQEADRIRAVTNLKRRELTAKFYGDTGSRSKVPTTTTIAPPSTDTPAPQPIAPESNPRAAEIRDAFRQGKITKEQAAQQLRELGFK